MLALVLGMSTGPVSQLPQSFFVTAEAGVHACGKGGEKNAFILSAEPQIEGDLRTAVPIFIWVDQR